MNLKEDCDGTAVINKTLLIAPIRPPLSLPQSPRRPRTIRRKKTGVMASLDVPEDEVVKPEMVYSSKTSYHLLNLVCTSIGENCIIWQHFFGRKKLKHI